ncbi:MAG: protein kinase, partial [Proteobacteria bacterium]|nr:protein kinase [Cystobacterineae bacterium]MCL2314636.1 protein kinase [Pseudomonadota bacterium]
MLSTDTIIGNRYIVKRKLAEGGMAEIYLCTAKGLEGFEKEVVIKCIRSFWGSDDLFVKMFIAEAHLASRLNHANIVQIFDFDKHEDSYYLAMEYVNGPSLRDFLRKTKEKDLPLPILMASEIVANIARGLHYAHNLNIVHRDVSPHNILLSFDGDIKLADFGIAKTDSQLTSPGVLKGKFAYMAPEQARGEAVDARTDIFSLGIVLWETLTRSRLFEYDSYINTLQALQENLIVQPSRFNTDVPEALDRIVLKALSRNAAERYQTAQELERALVNFILNHAHSADDTNLSHFLKLVYDDAASPPQEPKNPTRTYTPSHPAALAHPPPLPPTTSDADSPLPPDTLPQRRRNTPSPLPAPPEPPNNTTTEEFSYPSAKTTAPKNHKPFSRFLKHPIAIISSLAVLVGTGTYVFSWKNSRKPQPHLATHLELNASQTNSPPASPPPLTQNPKPLDQTELPPPEPAQPKNEANPPPQTT